VKREQKKAARKAARFQRSRRIRYTPPGRIVCDSVPERVSPPVPVIERDDTLTALTTYMRILGLPLPVVDVSREPKPAVMAAPERLG
jgi:hypothetical protein